MGQQVPEARTAFTHTRERSCGTLRSARARACLLRRLEFDAERAHARERYGRVSALALWIALNAIGASLRWMACCTHINLTARILDS